MKHAPTAHHLDTQGPGLHLQSASSTAPLRLDSGMRGQLSGFPLTRHSFKDISKNFNCSVYIEKYILLFYTWVLFNNMHLGQHTNVAAFILLVALATNLGADADWDQPEGSNPNAFSEVWFLMDTRIGTPTLTQWASFLHIYWES